MGDTALKVLKTNLENLSSSLVWLQRSYDRCMLIGIKAEYAEDEFDQFENLASRYARTVDLLVNKSLRSIDVVEFIDGGSIIDAANRAEKRGIVDSVSELRDLKDLRNEIAHEYETDDLPKFFGLILEAVPRLFVVADHIKEYCRRYDENCN
ncbi:MAG: hypothetical protein LBT14_11810 [Treponema sp.]|jgi:hypothetical protein|nr:hypothetical protein [Treponema sp.]